jgi:hypothetical protein
VVLLTWSSYDLPADVFVEGETRPAKAKKKNIPKASEAAANKRSFSSTGLDVGDGLARACICSYYHIETFIMVD